MKTPGEIVIKEVQGFKDETVMLSDGTSFSQYYTLQRINRYTNNKFWDCPDPNALFWNISNQRVPLYAKSIDANTKDFDIIGLGTTNGYQQWVINAFYKKWAREEQFAITLDETSTGISRNGSDIWKKVEVDGKVSLEQTNLSNLYFDQTVKVIRDKDKTFTPMVEMHYMTEMEIRSRWSEKADEVVEKGKEARDNEDNDAESEVPKYEVWERWGERQLKDNGDMVYMHDIGVGAGDLEVILVEDKVKEEDSPYYDFHDMQHKVKGRWLSVGVVERLFPLQEQINTLVNQNSEANSIASLLLFRTNDPNTTGNILQSAQSGQIINSDDMSQMGIDNRFISTFINQLQLIENKANELCYINDSISGDTPPSGVPFRSLAVSTRAALSTFRYIKTSVIEKMGYILGEEIFPSLVKKFNKEDAIEMSEDENDIREYDRRYIQTAELIFKADKVNKGQIIFQEDLQVVRAKAKEDAERGIRREEIGKKFFDFEFGFRMNPTGESVDKNTKNHAIDSATQDMLANPAVVNTPIYQQKLQSNGIPAFKLTPEEIETLQQGKTGAPIPEAPVDRLSELAQE